MLLKLKIYCVIVIEVVLYYEGSIMIDCLLMDLVRLIFYEKVDVYDIINGS